MVAVGASEGKGMKNFLNSAPPSTRELRQLVVVAMLAFVFGMTATLILIGWLMWRFADPGTPWYDLLHMSINGLLVSVLVGLAVMAGTVLLLGKWQDWHHRRGSDRATVDHGPC
jgi:hypothetical protein